MSELDAAAAAFVLGTGTLKAYLDAKRRAQSKQK
jgi:hypothetical protein